jgi:hypothetical protein
MEALSIMISGVPASGKGTLFFSSGEIGLGLGRNGSPEDYDFWSSGIWKGDTM